ncbi:MAG TPA: M20 family metallopeptidase [Anaerolineae bacterium]
MNATTRRDLLARLDPDEIAAVCADLVRLDTSNPPGHERAAAEYAAGYLGHEFETTFLPYPEDKTRASVVCRLRSGSGSTGAPALVFNGHLDVVPVGAQEWRHPPFAGEIAEGQVWGRGAADMKSGVAAMLVAAKALAGARDALALSGDLIVAATAGEEIGMNGAEQVAQWAGLRPIAGVIIAEPTDNRIGLAERGVLWIELVTNGKTAHGSTPYLGKNALNMMRKLLDAVDGAAIPFVRHPVLGDFTYSINTIHAGTAGNVVPDRCVASLDLRTVPGQDHRAILAHFNDLIGDLARRDPDFSAEAHASFDLPSADTPADAPVVGRFCAAVEAVTGQPAATGVVRFATEAGVFVPALGVPVIIYGPGHPDLAHQPDEHAPIAAMHTAAQVYVAAAAEILS